MGNENSDSGYVYIHKHIDSLPMFCNWEIDVVVTFFVFLEAGVFLADTFTGTSILIMVGFGASWVYSKIKDSSIKGFYSQLLYIFNAREPEYLIPSYKRFFIGA